MKQNLLSNPISISSENYIFVEEVYKKYLENPASVGDDWKNYFESNKDINEVLNDSKGPSWAKRDVKIVGQDFDISSLSKKEAKPEAPAAKTDDKEILKLRVLNLILAYRKFGHLACNLDPLGLTPTRIVPQLSLNYHNIKEADLAKEVELNGILGVQKAKVSQIVEVLNALYKSTIGSEFDNVESLEQIEWVSESLKANILADLTKEEKIKILKELVRTTKFEQFLHKRFPGAKRFSIEGGESSINAVEKIIDSGAKLGVKKIVIGMAHRGRLNTLTGIMGKPYHQMISEFKGTPGIPKSITALGDVKYHMGYASQRKIDGHKIDLSLAFNPSHLEAVNPVVMGRIRCKQDLYKDENRSQALALIIHGDAAFAGQGIVAETLMMSGIDGYNTGGVMHLIVNNQIGFTANPEDSRSTRYASDLAKAINAPIFHVNGDDVEAVVKVANIALAFRQQFKKDVVIDLICFRKYGHNEGDEPMYTQPVMYNNIHTHPTLETIYSDYLKSHNIVSEEEYNKIVADFEAYLSSEFDIAQTYEPKEGDWLKGDWSKIKDGDLKTPKTGIDAKKFHDLAEKITKIPDHFNLNPKIARQIEIKHTNLKEGKHLDWGTGEALAFASLLDEGFPVRITGQDAGRGTFSHRHSVYHDAQTGERYYPFNHLSKKAAKFEVHDSILSEYGVLGFEYGYSLSNPNALTIWEAQFGDFANGAQIMFDQFICSSEEKWLRKSNLVMLLPHGYEGQGPEHSSARLERYLQSCANNNIFVVNITTPGNFFHALRRQLYLGDRKPLVVMSPKSVLRNPAATSSINDFTGNTKFEEIIPETEKLVADDKIKKTVLCSGKVYYDLLAARTEAKIKDIALIRLEQLYPFPKEHLQKELKKYKNAEIVWCQEEPKNMGAWSFIHELVEEVLVEIKHKNSRPKFVGRIPSASTATGYGSYHAKEQKALIETALK